MSYRSRWVREAGMHGSSCTICFESGLGKGNEWGVGNGGRGGGASAATNHSRFPSPTRLPRINLCDFTRTDKTRSRRRPGDGPSPAATAHRPAAAAPARHLGVGALTPLNINLASLCVCRRPVHRHVYSGSSPGCGPCSMCGPNCIAAARLSDKTTQPGKKSERPRKNPPDHVWVLRALSLRLWLCYRIGWG